MNWSDEIAVIGIIGYIYFFGIATILDIGNIFFILLVSLFLNIRK